MHITRRTRRFPDATRRAPSLRVGVHGVSEDVTEANRVLRDLEAADAAKTPFLATVSHEVRTPPAAIVGASEPLRGSDLAPEPEHFAGSASGWGSATSSSGEGSTFGGPLRR